MLVVNHWMSVAMYTERCLVSVAGWRASGLGAWSCGKAPEKNRSLGPPEFSNNLRPLSPNWSHRLGSGWFRTCYQVILVLTHGVCSATMKVPPRWWSTGKTVRNHLAEHCCSLVWLRKCKEAPEIGEEVADLRDVAFCITRLCWCA